MYGNGITPRRQLLQNCSAVGSGGSGERVSRQPPLSPASVCHIAQRASASWSNVICGFRQSHLEGNRA